jgi:hypothetical protein
VFAFPEPSTGSGGGAVVTSLGLAILLVGVALMADVVWTEYRELRARRDAARRGHRSPSTLGAPRV